jgi:hypothetical protein
MITRLEVIDFKGMMASPPRLKSSIILSYLNFLPVLKLSCIKSIDQWMFGATGCKSASRHLHQVIEMAHKEDIKGSIELLVACVTELDKHDWRF